MNIAKKVEKLAEEFAACHNVEQKYYKIIEMGKGLAPMPLKEKIQKNLIEGCQSKTYIVTSLNENKLYFKADSDALISAGLAALLLEIYNSEKAEDILQHSPTFLQKFNLQDALSPNRSNGLMQILYRIRKEALIHIL